METTTYKVVCVGEDGVGKTAFLKRHSTGEFDPKYVATMGVEIVPLTFYTNKGPVCFNVWDCAGQEKFKGLGDGYWVGADAVVVFFDVTSRRTYKSVARWIAKVRKMCGNDIPIVVCGNKNDVKDTDRKVKLRDIHPDPTWCAYYDVSAKSNYNFEKPFLRIVREKMGEDTRFEIGKRV